MPSPNEYKTNNVPISSEIVQAFLNNQAKELELKKQAEENSRQMIKYNYELAKQSLQLQSVDMKEEREHEKVMSKRLMIFFSILAFLIFVFVGWALFLGKEDFILSVIHIIFYSGSGVLMGSSWQKYQQSKTQKDEILNQET